jgi:hypothetical protein
MPEVAEKQPISVNTYRVTIDLITDEVHVVRQAPAQDVQDCTGLVPAGQGPGGQLCLRHFMPHKGA